MQVTAAMVKELRERSGAGMMECKKALVETSGDVEAALEHLRKSGAAKAAKKAGRVASDGAIIVRNTDTVAAIVEVNSETDFVAADANFESFANDVMTTILDNRPSSIEQVGELVMPSGGSVEEARTQLITKIGENISIRRFEVVDSQGGAFSSYLHGKRIGVLVEVEGGDENLARERRNAYCSQQSDLHRRKGCTSRNVGKRAGSTNSTGRTER